MANKLFIGTSGYNYREWKGRFYPEKLPQKEWLSYYAEQFGSVEINNSFYGSVKKETYEKWYRETPADFRFVIKGHRYITQLKKLKDTEESTELFLSAALTLREKLAALLWQFPAGFKLSHQPEEYFGRLRHFLALLPEDVPQAFEFRDSSWFTPEVNALLEAHNASLVISQSGVFPEIEMPNNAFVYIRFHGPTFLYSSGYTDEELQIWAERIKAYLESRDVYVYFNNDAGGFALANARMLQSYIR